VVRGCAAPQPAASLTPRPLFRVAGGRHRPQALAGEVCGRSAAIGGTMFFKRLASVLFPRGPRSSGGDTDSHLGRPTLTIGGTSGASLCKLSITSGPPHADVQLSEEDAVRVFFNEMMEWVAGEEMAFREISKNYKAMLHIRRGWPSVSDKALSQYLVGLGCKRRKTRKGGARPTLIRFPEYQSDKVVSIRRAVA
jgi:hypothetical protein